MYWTALGLAGSSLIVSVATLYLVWGVRRSTRRAARSGDERLEILREQQHRLEFLREERHMRHMQEEELEWRRSRMAGEDGPLELSAPAETNGHPESEQWKLRSWLRHVFGG